MADASQLPMILREAFHWKTWLAYMRSFWNDKPSVLEPHLNVPDTYGLTHGFPLKYSLAAPPRISTTVPSPFLSFIRFSPELTCWIDFLFIFCAPPAWYKQDGEIFS